MTDLESKDKGLSKVWVFLGGCLTGVAGVFVAAMLSEESDTEMPRSEDELLALPEGLPFEE